MIFVLLHIVKIFFYVQSPRPELHTHHGHIVSSKRINRRPHCSHEVNGES